MRAHRYYQRRCSNQRLPTSQIRRVYELSDRGRDEGLPSPLPPNRTGEFLASGFPVSGLFSEVGAQVLQLRLRRSTQAARWRHRSSASINSSCEGFQQTFDRHACFVTLPCLARGTRDSLYCSNASLTLPPSCPPSLHGHYSLHRYYEDSDSCPAPSSTRTGILGSCALRFQTFRLHPPYAPLFRRCFCSGQAWPPVHLGGYRQCFGLRSLLAVSSVASGRIEFVSWASTVPIALRTICSLPVALHLASRRRSYFLLLAVSSTREGLSPSCARSLPSALAAAVSAAVKPGILPGGPRAKLNSTLDWQDCARAAGCTLYGRRDACCHVAFALAYLPVRNLTRFACSTTSGWR
jgi:hypothetical protein